MCFAAVAWPHRLLLRFDGDDCQHIVVRVRLALVIAYEPSLGLSQDLTAQEDYLRKTCAVVERIYTFHNHGPRRSEVTLVGVRWIELRQSVGYPLLRGRGRRWHIYAYNAVIVSEHSLR